MNRNLVGFGKRYGTDNEEYKVRGGAEMTGRGELWHTKEEEATRQEIAPSGKHKYVPVIKRMSKSENVDD